MSWTRQGSGSERRGYHHGNLREALLDAALALIAAKGPAGLAIAEAARLAGVSPGAPYRHFRDADALIAEVAVRGFERFADSLTRAWNDGRPDPLRAFEALGRAYLAFARQEPAYYAAMFEARIAAEAHPGLQAAGDRAFAVIRDASERLIVDLPPQSRPPALMMALHVWSRRKLPMSPEDLLEAGLLLYFQSLGLAGAKKTG
jgi:AcrR family transcriptional regulator